MTQHARLSPSSADRFFVCPGSVRLIEKLRAAGVIPARSSSGAAAEGTCAHMVREECLLFGLSPFDYVGQTLEADGYKTEWTDEFANHLMAGQDLILAQPGELIIEHKVNLDHWMPGQFGTLDTAIIQRFARKLIVLDLKFGAGIPVSPVENRQLRIYALGIIENFNLWLEIDEIEIIIDQPRAGGLKHWTVSLKDLLAFGEELRIAAQRCDDPDAPLVFSEKGCTFCEVKNTPQGCPAVDQFMHDLLDDALNGDLDEDPKLPVSVAPERRWYIVQHAHLVEKWLAKLHADSTAAALAGQPDPGSKLVLGRRGNRRYSDEARAEAMLVEHLGDKAFTRKILSFAEAEKQFKPKRGVPGNPTAMSALEQLMTQDDGKPILVPESDDRPAIAPVDDLFDDDDLLS